MAKLYVPAEVSTTTKPRQVSHPPELRCGPYEVSEPRVQAMAPEAQFCKGPMVKSAAWYQLVEGEVQHSVMYCSVLGLVVWKSVRTVQSRGSA